ncbi:hypothetical protein [Oscillospiraceae bacterium]|nr:hypothetical protein [Oscillospiraceae bacterium]
MIVFHLLQPKTVPARGRLFFWVFFIRKQEKEITGIARKKKIQSKDILYAIL